MARKGYAQHFSALRTPQSQPIPGATQVPNSAGGFTWQIDDWSRLDRFLILGSDTATYYASAKKLTRENADVILRCLVADGPRTVSTLTALSEAGRAPKNEPAVFALALAVAFGDPATKALALAALPRVCRIGTDLFHFMEAYRANGRMGRSVRRALGKWYTDRPMEQVSYQAIKYQQRDGWSHRDVLRLARPKGRAMQAPFRWMVKADLGARSVGPKDGPTRMYEAAGPLPVLMEAANEIQAAQDVATVCRLIRDHRLPREIVPSQWLEQDAVWEALLYDMPMTAMIRNLATLTRRSVVAPLSTGTAHVLKQLGDTERLLKARVHPIAVLAALKVYAQGHGERSETMWKPVSQVLDALNAAFYVSFGSLPTSQRAAVLALDVSGSMGSGMIAGIPGLTPREASAAMAMVFMRQYPQYAIVGFTAGTSRTQHAGYGAAITPLAVSPAQRLDNVVRAIANLPFGGTDCALPMLWAQKEKLSVDAFVILTDNETWAGNIHPAQALADYRRSSNKPQAKCAVIGVTATECSIADPNDAGMLDFIGFDTAVPTLLADFIG